MATCCVSAIGCLAFAKCPSLAHRDLASRIHVRSAPQADMAEPTCMTHSGLREVHHIRPGLTKSVGQLVHHFENLRRQPDTDHRVVARAGASSFSASSGHRYVLTENQAQIWGVTGGSRRPVSITCAVEIFAPLVCW